MKFNMPDTWLIHAVKFMIKIMNMLDCSMFISNTFINILYMKMFKLYTFLLYHYVIGK